jgi:hypothetical protein
VGLGWRIGLIFTEGGFSLLSRRSFITFVDVCVAVLRRLGRDDGSIPWPVAMLGLYLHLMYPLIDHDLALSLPLSRQKITKALSTELANALFALRNDSAMSRGHRRNVQTLVPKPC